MSKTIKATKNTKGTRNTVKSTAKSATRTSVNKNYTMTFKTPVSTQIWSVRGERGTIERVMQALYASNNSYQFRFNNAIKFKNVNPY